MPIENGIVIAVEDGDFASALAGELAERCITYYVSFHSGLLQWQFIVEVDNVENIGQAIASVGGRMASNG